MRRSAINAVGINVEPMNGQGVYPIVKTLEGFLEHSRARTGQNPVRHVRHQRR